MVTGRIVQHGDQLIISSELIDARTSRNLWGDQYDRKLSDALAVQQEITGAISARLRERLSGETQKQVAKGGTSDPEAYQLYLKGLYYWEKRTPETLDKARDYFNQAIQQGPRLRHGVRRAGQLLRRCAGLRSDSGERSRPQSESGGRESPEYR